MKLHNLDLVWKAQPPRIPGLFHGPLAHGSCSLRLASQAIRTLSRGNMWSIFMWILLNWYPHLVRSRNDSVGKRHASFFTAAAAAQLLHPAPPCWHSHIFQGRQAIPLLTMSLPHEPHLPPTPTNLANAKLFVLSLISTHIIFGIVISVYLWHASATVIFSCNNSKRWQLIYSSAGIEATKKMWDEYKQGRSYQETKA
jgi:hypothetical protein